MSINSIEGSRGKKGEAIKGGGKKKMEKRMKKATACNRSSDPEEHGCSVPLPPSPLVRNMYRALGCVRTTRRSSLQASCGGRRR